MGKVVVEICRRNWDVDYLHDIISGKGFTITESDEFQLDEKSVKALYGSRSPLYGTDYSDEQAFIERYSCTCGEFKGKLFEGEMCPLCNTPIEFKDVDITFTGWISLHGNYIIQPYYYNLLKDTIGKKVFPEIVITKNKVDTDGHIRKLKAEEIVEDPKHPFVGIGVVEFRDRFEEVMRYFQKSKKAKHKIIERLIKERDKVFTSHIPVYSTLLRKESITADTYYHNSMDKNINPIFKLSEKLRDCYEIEKHFILARIQSRVNKLWDTNFDLMNGKEGIIRGQILGGSLDFTSRNVIIPNPELRDNEIDVSYNTFRELYKYKIIYYLMKMDDIPLSKAYAKWSESFIFDNKVYQTMLYIVEKEKPSILINRNPTLD